MADDKDTIEVQRRRQGASSGPEGRERPGAPVRRRPEDAGGSGGPGGSGGFGGSSSGGGGGSSLPIGKLPWWAILLLVVLFVGYNLLTGGGGGQDSSTSNTSNSGDQNTTITEAASSNTGNTNAGGNTVTQATLPPTRAASNPSAANAPAASGKGQKWTVMLYEDADDQILEEDMMMDMNEAERVGSTDRVNIVAQMDRYKGAYTGDGNWTSARRYYLTQDNDLNKLNSKVVSDLGEVDMADGNTLADFVDWAVKTYPADRYVLILSDHGMGWPGGWSDPAPATKDSSRLPIASALDSDQIYLNELDGALSKIQSQTNLDKFELIGMDACLMSHLEVMTMLEPYARYAVLSQETEPALGWAYTAFLTKLVQNPDMNGSQLGSNIVQSYIKDDERIVDDQARAAFVRGNYTAAQVAQEMSQDVTLTAVDLSAIPALNDAVNQLAYALQSEDDKLADSARTYAQAYTNVFSSNKNSPYIDLGSFVKMLKKEGLSGSAAGLADQVVAAEKQAVVAEKHGTGKPGATGVSIYFPNSTLYRSPIAGPESYTGVAQRFAETSLWDDFLAYHYNSVAFKADTKKAAVPSASTKSRAPGKGAITISAIKLSGSTAEPGKPVTMSAQIKGSNLGYTYLFVGYYDKVNNSVFVADMDYLQSPDTREQDGVFYPVWKDSFTMKLDWDPTVFEISDGSKSAVALLTPQSYGKSAQEALYTVDGIYTYADGTKRDARLYLRNGKVESVFGFTGQNFSGSPAEIVPQSGDTFTLLEKWLDLNSAGNVTATNTQEGETFTFGDQPFTWKEVYAAPGTYQIGFVVEDLDGNQKQAFTQVEVK